MLLLRMINGKDVPTKAVIAGLAKELVSDPSYLEKLAARVYTDSTSTPIAFGGLSLDGAHGAAITFRLT